MKSDVIINWTCFRWYMHPAGNHIYLLSQCFFGFYNLPLLQEQEADMLRDELQFVRDQRNLLSSKNDSECQQKGHTKG